jgi:hypothetical protein
MKNLLKKKFDMLVRVRRFGVENAPLFPERTPAGMLFADLDRVINEFTATTTGHVDGEKRSAAGAKSRARRALREDVDAICQTARVLSDEIPVLDGKFKFRKPLSDSNLAVLARAFGAYAAPWRERFVRQGLPENFLEDLAADLAAFESADEWKATAASQRAAAGRTLERLADQGVKTVAKIDSVVRNVFRKDQWKLAEWKRAKTVVTSPTQPTAAGEAKVAESATASSAAA